MALHEQSVGATSEWYTPRYIFDALACKFDMDVASPGRAVTPWIPARKFITERSLSRQWEGFVWMNPPFGGRNAIRPWLVKFREHRNGIALTPDRTSAPWWQDYARHMDAILFVSPKIKFISATGLPGKSPAQGTCLMALGEHAILALRQASGKLGVICYP